MAEKKQGDEVCIEVYSSSSSSAVIFIKHFHLRAECWAVAGHTLNFQVSIRFEPEKEYSLLLDTSRSKPYHLIFQQGIVSFTEYGDINDIHKPQQQDCEAQEYI